MEQDDLPTVADGGRHDEHTPTSKDRSAGSGTSNSYTLSASTIEIPKPETALRRSAYEQTRRTAASGFVFNVLGLVVAPFIGGDQTALFVFMVAMVMSLFNNALLLYVSRDENRYRQRHAIRYFAIAPLLNAGILYYIGTFGPVLVMFVFNVYTACIAYSRRVAQVSLVGSIGPFVLVGGLMTLGILDDPGLVTLTDVVGTAGRWVVLASFSLFLYLTYAQGRETRDLMVASLVERDAAVRSASHREALLLEARQDLENALQAGGLGRFTEQTLGSFKLGAVLGRGGMGEVYDAIHFETGAPAAVKMLLPEVLGRPEFVRRFLREVRIAASLESPHVVKVLEVGDESAPIPFLAMEKLRGRDLAQILRHEPRMNPAEVVDLVRQVGRGVTAAGKAGIVHRDLKPQNIYLSDGPPPTWKILDFGISKLMEGDGALTQGEAIGTPRYMAPEQARGGDVDTRADLYALGVIAYRALTGHPPFKGDGTAPVLVQVLDRMPARPTSLTKLPPQVDPMFAIALAKKPEDRFQTADALTAALDAALRGKLSKRDRDQASELLAALPWPEDP